MKPSLDKEELHFPTWNMVLEHLGQNLDNAVAKHPWMKENGIITGADYLRCWMASVFQEPLKPTPYLFFWSSEQNTGKSTFHELFLILLDKGYQRAEEALTNKNNFNGELENAVICAVEERDLRKDRTTANRIKDWVTSLMVSIHRKGMTPYLVPNTTHWIQCSNYWDSCPIFAGDSRITAVHVSKIPEDKLIPKEELRKRLELEASDFLASVLRLELPKSNDRLNLPIIETDEKMSMARTNRSLLEQFIAEKCYYVPGEVIIFAEFCDKFHEFIDPTDRAYWSKIRIGRELPLQYPSARLRVNGYKHVGNISWTPAPEGTVFKKRLIEKDDYLESESENG